MNERTIYAVIYSNYDPPEVNSLWSDEQDAQARADELGSPWTVSPMTLGERKASGPFVDVGRLQTARDHLRKHVEGIDDGSRLPLASILGMIDGIAAEHGEPRGCAEWIDVYRCILTVGHAGRHMLDVEATPPSEKVGP